MPHAVRAVQTQMHDADQPEPKSVAGSHGTYSSNNAHPVKARYVHTNLTARDWRQLARFYCDVFGCVPKLPERDLRGEWLEELTAMAGAHLTGVHLSLPGFGADGPTLEIFTYDAMERCPAPTVKRPGFGHIAFAVENVDDALAAVIAAGGSTVGELVRTHVPGVGLLDVVYARDLEGNIVEIQKWRT